MRFIGREQSIERHHTILSIYPLYRALPRSSSLRVRCTGSECPEGTLSCANTYCHGNIKNGNSEFAPVWNDVTNTQAACGTCHGQVVDANLRIIDKSKHINGRLEISGASRDY